MLASLYMLGAGWRRLAWYRKVAGVLAGCLLLLGLWWRLVWLSQIPFSYYHDEMDHVFLGESLARFGTDPTGQWVPWSLTPIHTINVVAELPAVFHALAQLIWGFGPQSGHIPNAVFGLATVLAVGVLGWQITRSQLVGVVTAGLLAVSPWHVFISRLAYEAPLSLFFQVTLILAMTQLLRSDRHTINKRVMGWLLLMVTSAILAFFTYHGAKITVLALLGLGSVVSLWQAYVKLRSVMTHKSGKHAHISTYARQCVVPLATIAVAVSVGSGLLWQYASISSQGLYGERQKELLLDSTYLAEQVNLLRQRSLSFPLQAVFINKATVFGLEGIKRAGFALDVNRVIFQGSESGFQFSLFVTGYFFLSMVVWLAVGTYRVVLERYWWLVSILLLGMLPSLLTIGYQSVFRSSLLYAGLHIVAGLGVVYVLKAVKTKKLIPVILMLIVIAEAVYASYIYLSRYPVVMADNHYFSDIVLARYLASGTPTVVVVSGPAYRYARNIVSYNQWLGNLSEEQRHALGDPRLTSYQLGSVLVTQDCAHMKRTDLPVVVSYELLEECQLVEEEQHFIANTNAADSLVPSKKSGIFSLSSPIDSGAYFYIFQDVMCEEYSVPKYVHAATLKEYHMYSLSDEVFCQTWLKVE